MKNIEDINCDCDLEKYLFTNDFGIEEYKYFIHSEYNVKNEYFIKFANSYFLYKLYSAKEAELKDKNKQFKLAKFNSRKLKFLSVFMGAWGGAGLLQSGLLLAHDYKGLAIFGLGTAIMTTCLSVVLAAVDENQKKQRPPEVQEAEKQLKNIKKYLKSSLKESKVLKKKAEKEYTFMLGLCKESGIDMAEFEQIEQK